MWHVKQGDDEHEVESASESPHEYLSKKYIKDVADKGVFFLMGEIGENDMCDAFMLWLTRHIQRLGNARVGVEVVICSSGGDADVARAMVAMVDMAKRSGVEVVGKGCGQVCSAALDVLVSCSKRIAHPLTIFMLHAESADVRNPRQFNLIRGIDSAILDKYTKLTKAQRERFLDGGDWYFGAQEALEWGVVDEVME